MFWGDNYLFKQTFFRIAHYFNCKLTKSSDDANTFTLNTDVGGVNWFHSGVSWFKPDSGRFSKKSLERCEPRIQHCDDNIPVIGGHLFFNNDIISVQYPILDHRISLNL